jgi:uncharacterized repeat protein (TIGR01451 family)
MRRTAAMAIALILGAALADSGFAVEVVPPAGVEKDDSEIFKPTTDSGPFLSVYDSTTLGSGRFKLGYWQDYANKPLKGHRVVGGNDENISLVEHLSTLNLVGAIGITRGIEVGVHLPLYFTSLAGRQVGLERLDGNHFNIGDVGLNAKIDLLPDLRADSGFGLSLLPMISMPTGSSDNFAGIGEFSAGGLVIADYVADPWRYALNLGGVLRSGTPESQLKWGLAVSRAIGEKSSVIAEIYGLTDAGDPWGREFRSPFEMLGAVRFPVGPVDLTLGFGGGLDSAKNDPRFRILLGVTSPAGVVSLPSRARVAEIDLSTSRKTYVVEDYDRNGKVSPGDVIVYTITLINTGRGTAPDVVVSDPIPAYTDFVPGTIQLNDQPVADAEGYASYPPRIEVRIPSLSSRSGSNLATIKFKTRIRSIPTVVAVRNEATVTAPGIGTLRLPVVETTVLTETAEREHVTETAPQVSSVSKLEITQNIQFEPASAKIQPSSFIVLDEVASILKEKPAMTLSIVGHTDDVGPSAANVRLSRERAEAVRAYLISKGIAAHRLHAVGRGPAEPVATNQTEAGRAANRRVEFLVTGGNP